MLEAGMPIVSTKIPILLGTAFGPFSLGKLPSYGLWSFLHEARTDWCMLLGCLAIVLARTGPQGSASSRS
jgi:hypothetical protein